MNKKIQETLKNIPKLPGVYSFLNKKGEIIYIGKSVNLKSRVNSYFNSIGKLNFAKKKMVSYIDKIETIITNTAIESLLLETNLIKKHKPKYNILMKDDKSHTYIKITNDTIPKIIKTRIKNKSGVYFGPYISTNYVNNILKLTKKIFGYRSCNIIFKKEDDLIKIKSSNGTKIPCIDYYIKRCAGPCLLGQNEIIQYQKNIDDIKNFLKGNIQEVLLGLKDKMQEYAKKLDFEKAQKIKENIESISQIQENQIVSNIIKTDTDIINYLEKYSNIYISQIQVRNSKIVGIYNFEIQNILGDIDEVVEYFIEKTYIENKKKLNIIIKQQVNIQEEILEGLNLKIEIPKIGEKQELLKLAYKNAFEFAYKKHLESLSVKGFTKKDMEELLKILGYKKINKDIIFECNDISHISGNHTVASRSVIENGKTNPKKYKKFKINTIIKHKINDFGSMEEIINRRIKEIIKTKQIPDLIIIDGGKGQLSAVMKVVESFKNNPPILSDIPLIKGYSELCEQGDFIQKINSLQIVSLAKKEEELFLPGKKESILVDKDSNILRMIQKIRDEAHRFAITFNRDKRIKASKVNILESIPGIGPKTRKKLLSHFGSISKIENNADLKKILNKTQIESLENHGVI